MASLLRKNKFKKFSGIISARAEAENSDSDDDDDDDDDEDGVGGM